MDASAGHEPIVNRTAILPNAAGLHARPVVKLIQLAKSFSSRVEIALDAAGPWINAKSPVAAMRARAGKGAVVHVRAEGPDADHAVAAVVALIDDGFGED